MLPIGAAAQVEHVRPPPLALPNSIVRDADGADCAVPSAERIEQQQGGVALRRVAAHQPFIGGKPDPVGPESSVLDPEGAPEPVRALLHDGRDVHDHGVALKLWREPEIGHRGRGSRHKLRSEGELARAAPLPPRRGEQCPGRPVEDVQERGVVGLARHEVVADHRDRRQHTERVRRAQDGARQGVDRHAEAAVIKNDLRRLAVVDLFRRSDGGVDAAGAEHDAAGEGRAEGHARLRKGEGNVSSYAIVIALQ